MEVVLIAADAEVMETSTRAAGRPYLWVLGLLWGLPLVAVGTGWLVLPKEVGPGQCEGIGFGCTLTPADMVLLLGLLAAPVLLLAGLAAAVVVAVVQGRRARRARTRT